MPVAAAVLLIAPRVIRESRGAGRTRLDVPGALTVTTGLLALVLGLTRAGEHGFTDPAALAGLAVGAVLLVAFHAVGALLDLVDRIVVGFDDGRKRTSNDFPEHSTLWRQQLERLRQRLASLTIEPPTRMQ